MLQVELCVSFFTTNPHQGVGFTHAAFDECFMISISCLGREKKKSCELEAVKRERETEETEETESGNHFEWIVNCCNEMPRRNIKVQICFFFFLLLDS